MADHDKPEKVTVDPGVVAREIPQGAIAIGESPNHESSDVRLRPIITTTMAILLIIAISDAALYGLYKFWQAREAAKGRADSPLVDIKPPVEDPQLQVDEPAAQLQHRADMTAPIEGYHWVEPGKTAAIPVDEAMKKVAETGKLPSGPEWSMRPDERMVGGVILNAEQVKYANTPPSQASVESPTGAPAPGQPGLTAPPNPPPSPPGAPAGAATPGGQPPARTRPQAQPAEQHPLR